MYKSHLLEKSLYSSNYNFFFLIVFFFMYYIIMVRVAHIIMHTATEFCILRVRVPTYI